MDTFTSQSYITNSVEQNPSWEPVSCSAVHEIHPTDTTRRF